MRQKLVEHADGVYRPAFTAEHTVRDQAQYQWSVRTARILLHAVVDQHVRSAVPSCRACWWL